VKIRIAPSLEHVTKSPFDKIVNPQTDVAG